MPSSGHPGVSLPAMAPSFLCATGALKKLKNASAGNEPGQKQAREAIWAPFNLIAYLLHLKSKNKGDVATPGPGS